MVSYAVAANAGASRNGSLTIGGQAFTVVQDAACTFSIAPASQTIGAAGGSGAIAVTTAASCAWRATSNSTWLTIDGPSSGAGNGSVSFSAAPNSGMAREGTIVIAGQTFTLAQPAP